MDNRGNYRRRIDHLEEKMGMKSQPYPHVIVTNLPPDEESGCSFELAPGRVYVDVIGRELVPGEIEQLRVDWLRKHGVEKP